MKGKPMSPKAYAIATNGDLWYWNCGWWRNKGNQSKPLGHLQFRSVVKLLNPTTPDAKTVLTGMDRPQRRWRRVTAGNELMEHKYYGLVKLLATDGCHAVISSHNFTGTKRVSYDNLNEREKVKEPKKATAKKKGKGSKKPKTKQLVNKYLDMI